ncbi:nuclease domain-containing protein [Pandoraea apista]|nr:nuclease domain-containing protein [Pandoraea apista]
MQRKTPMKRTGFKRKAPAALSPFSGAAALKGTTFKRKAPKKRLGDDRDALDACRGQPCYLRIPGVCCGNWETVVPAHRNEGKGMGLKTPDRLTVPACFTCHTEYDQGNKLTRDEKRGLFNAAYDRWAQYRDRKFGLGDERND